MCMCRFNISVLSGDHRTDHNFSRTVFNPDNTGGIAIVPTLLVSSLVLVC